MYVARTHTQAHTHTHAHTHVIHTRMQAPEELTEAVDWALTHDQQASQIASAGQQLALQYLNKQVCYTVSYTVRSTRIKLVCFRAALCIWLFAETIAVCCVCYVCLCTASCAGSVLLLVTYDS